MALLPIQSSTPGLNPNWAACAIGGDAYPNTGKETIHLRNEGPNQLTVFVTPQNACNQLVKHTVAYIIPAQVGSIPTVVLLGPEAFQFYNDNNGRAQLTYSSPVQTPPGAPDLALINSGQLVALGIATRKYAITFVNGSGETTGGVEVNIITASGFQAVGLQGIPLGAGGTTKRGIYRSPSNGGPKQLVTYLADNTTTSFVDTLPDSLLGAAIPLLNTAAVPAPGAPTLAAGGAGNPNGTYRGAVTFLNAQGETTGGAEALISVANQQINWSTIPLGPAGTTARNLYRSPTLKTGDSASFTESATVNSTTVGDSDVAPAPATVGTSGTERLVTTLNDNTTTVFNGDNLTDAQLAANALIPSISTANVLQIAVTAP